LMIFIGISILTGTFVQLFIILSIVTIHELGHFYAAKFFKWRIEKIMLWAFGGVLKTDEYTTRPVREELIVTLCGPLQHGLIFILTYCLYVFDMLPITLFEQINNFNLIILLFNLLPIYPLDGGRISFVILSSTLPYRSAYRIILLFSFIFAFCMIVIQLSLY